MDPSLISLPVELQSDIIRRLPINDWPKVAIIPFLKAGLDLPSLWKVVNLDEVDEISNAFVDLALNYGKHVKKFYWDYSVWKSDVHPTEFLNTLSAVKEVSIVGNDNLCTLQWLCNNNEITHLSVAQCNNIIGSDFDAVVPTLKNLVSLDVSECYQCSKDKLLNILPQLPYLEYCNVRDCCSFEYDVIIELVTDLPCVKQLSFCPEVIFDDCSCWARILEQEDSPLDICPAMAEIIEDMQ